MSEQIEFSARASLVALGLHTLCVKMSETPNCWNLVS
jgi:hypothetical protein